MSDASSRGPEVPANEDLLRTILHPKWWDPDGKHLSSGVFAFRKFSAYIESMTTAKAILARFRDGSGMIKFNCGVARDLGFDARHEPEDGNDAHANVYRDCSSSRRKKQTRKLVDASIVTIEPDVEKLRASA